MSLLPDMLPKNKTKKRKLEGNGSSNGQQSDNSNNDEQLQESRRNLPVYSFRKQLIESVNVNPENKVLLVAAETGSGKSTQIPAYMLPYMGRMVVTQPRRVAAVTLASRVAYENGCKTGQRVGYRVRFDDCTSAETQLVYATDGMLLREAMTDPLLHSYSVIFLDECHERSLQTDILIGVVHGARKARKAKEMEPLQLVLMSATLEISKFKEFFGDDNISVMEIPGRQYPVQTLYTDNPMNDYMEAALSTIVQIHANEPPGDILVFLTGQDEIENISRLLRQVLQEDNGQSKQQWTEDQVQSLLDVKQISSTQSMVNGVLICPLYAALPPEAQMFAFEEKPAGCVRKIILSTNIAETSVTIPDIKYVVDTGKHKCRQVLSTGMETLRVQDISQAQAAQRAGRAGRVQAGFCFRLYTEDAFTRLAESSLPEILRVSLSQVVLQLKGMGIPDPREFDFVTPPETNALRRAIRQLYALKALDDELQLTQYGTKLAKLPLDPIYGHLLLQSAEYSCTREILTIVSVLSSDHLLFRPNNEFAAKATAAHRRFTSHEGDLPTFLNVYNAWQNEAIFVPVSAGGLKAQNKIWRRDSTKRLFHMDWCHQNFISGRSLVRAYDIRQQLEQLCSNPRSGLNIDVTSSSGKDQVRLLKCVAAGLFLQSATRLVTQETSGSGRVGSSHGKYLTTMGKDTVSIHPTSLMFGRQPAPSCIVYSELVATKRTYIRGVTQIKVDWLKDFAPTFFSDK